MSKNRSHQSPADLRVAEWRKLHDEAEALAIKLSDHVKAKGLYRGESLERTKLELKCMEAREREAVAERAAVLALDAAELAEGHEDARTRDLPTLRTDLVELFAETAKLEIELNAARNRIHVRVQSAQRAEGATKARRAAAGLPFVGTGFAPNPAKQLFGVDEAIARGIPSSHYAGEVTRLRNLLISTAAKLEEQRLAEEAKAKQKKWERDMDQRKADDIQRRARERAKEQNDAVEEDERRRDGLAAAYLARVGGA